MIRLILIRHGESTSDLEPRRIEGMADFPLSERGEWQVAQLGRRIAADYRLDELIASPLKRARQTADAVSAACGLPYRIDERIREKSYGKLGGLTFQEADEQYPHVNWRMSPTHEVMPEGESTLHQFQRVADFWFSLYDGPNDRTIAVVSHGGTIQCLYRAALGLPVNTPNVFGTGDTCVHEWQFEPGGRIRVALANCTRHLIS